MRWWMMIEPRAMAVENANVVGMDFTILPSNTAMVEWQDGIGEIEYNDRPRLRESFQDVMPYVPLFQQFMTLLAGQTPALTLRQAKKLQGDLIKEIFDCKRQEPIDQDVGGTTYTFDASDESVTAMCATMLGGSTTGSSALIAEINTNIVTRGNFHVSEVNSAVVGSSNNSFNQLSAEVNVRLCDQGNALISHYNETVLGHVGDPFSGPNSINNKLQLNGGVATPGLSGEIGGSPASFAYVGDSLGVSATTANPFISLGGGGAPDIPWTPIDATDPVDMTSDEMAALMASISSRRQDLLTHAANLKADINALTDVDDVIAYDITAGW